MIAPTHAIYGPAVALIILAVFGVEASFHWTVIFCAMLGSVLPDIDHPTSTVGRLVPWISKPLERNYGHRAVTHSFLGTVVAATGFLLILSISATLIQKVLLDSISLTNLPLSLVSLNFTFTDVLRLTAAFTLGYGSHIVLDMLTPRGVELLWPNPNRHVLFKDKLQVETASKGELPVAALGLVLLVLALPLSRYGPMTAFRWMLATPEAAIQEFKSTTTRTYVEFDGIWTATKTPIHATAEVLDVHNKRLVIALDSPEASPDALRAPATRSHSGIRLQASGTAECRDEHRPAQASQSKDTVSASSDRPANGFSNSPPTRTRVVVTLSDELSADISTQKVHLIKSDKKIRVDKYSFKNQSREALLKRLPEDVVISGVVYLPKGLKVALVGSFGNVDSESVSGSVAKSLDLQGISQESDGAEKNWKSIEQVGNELRLHFATKSELKSLELDQAFFDAQKQDKLKLKRLEFRRKELNSKIQKLEHPRDGLTDLGRRLLSTLEKEDEKKEKIAQINQQIESVESDIEEVQRELAQKAVSFSGWVRVRLKT